MTEPTRDPYRTEPPPAVKADPYATEAPPSGFETEPPPADDAFGTEAPPTVAPALAESPPRPPRAGVPWSANGFVGTLLGNWVVERLLGEGAWGAVFLAHDARDAAKKAALKIPKLGDSKQAAHMFARFRQEVATLQRIHARGPSRHIVGLLNADVDARPFPWLALEYVEGTDLGSELKRRRKIAVRDALPLALAILDGLIEAHAAGAVHRDLKPENVLRTFSNEIRIADFGMARLVTTEGEGGAETGVTLTGQIIGSLHYMSPEQIKELVDQRGDIYSFGAMLYHVISGRPPFRGGRDAIYNGHLSGVPTPLAEFVVGVPAKLSELVAKLLAKEPAERPTALEAQAEIKEVLRLLEAPGAKAPEDATPIAMELAAGDEVDEYIVEREIGRGGMGIVYAVKNQQDEPFALKVAGFAFSSQEQARKQLVRDAQNAIEVTNKQPHPAVAKVYGAGDTKVRGVPIAYLVSELVQGPSLAKLIDENGSIPERAAIDLWRSVAEGLGAVHESKVLHLDVTPGNILLSGRFDEGGDPEAQIRAATPKIVDFGISRRVDMQTMRGIEGNPGYMSPEQCDGVAPTYATDIYMLGATFYHATTGLKLFSGEPLAVMNQQRHDLPKFAHLDDPAVGIDLGLVIHKCLFKKPEDRYANVGALVEDLALVGSSKFPRSQRRAEWEREVASLDKRARTPWKLIATLVAVFVLILAAGGAYAFDQNRKNVVRTFEKRIDDAAEDKIDGLVKELKALGGPDAPALERRLDDRVGALLAGMALGFQGQWPFVVTDPDGCRTKLSKLDDRVRNLRDAALAHPVWSSALMIGDDHPVPLLTRLQQLEQNIAVVESLCAIKLDIDERKWDDAQRGLASLGADPTGVRPQLEAGIREGIASLEKALAEVTAVVDAKLDDGLFGEAQSALLGFADPRQHGHPDYARHDESARAYAALKQKIDVAYSKADPIVRKAETAHSALDQRLGELGLADLLASKQDPERLRQPLSDAITACDEFLERTVDGRKAAFANTHAGGLVREKLQEARQRFAKLAGESWTAERGKCDRLWALADSPEKFHELKAALEAWRDWDRFGGSTSDEVVLPASSPPTTCAQARATELARVRGALEAAIRGVVETSETALRKHDLSGAAARADDARRFQGEPEFAAAFGARMALIEKQLRLFADLDKEAVAITVPPGYWLGQEGHPRWKKRPYGGPASLLVDKYETTVKTYAVFLEYENLFEPKNDATPDNWKAQAEHPDHPVVGVSWAQASACAAWAGRTLLTADEWEVAARGSSEDEERMRAWHTGAAKSSEGFGGTGPIDKGAAAETSDWGVADAAGNVSEWTSTPGPVEKSHVYCGPNFTTHETRDENWLFLRGFAADTDRAPHLGFRCVREGNK